MIWLSTAKILLSFLAAGLTVWFAPDLLTPLGLGEFAFTGQLCGVILILSLLERIFSAGKRGDGDSPSPP